MGKFFRLAQSIGKTCQSGEIVFRQGDEAGCMYLLYSGAVAVYREGDVERALLDKLGPGDVFGEMALVDEKPRSATVTALEDSVLIPVTASFLKENILKDPRFIFQIIETLILRIESTAISIRHRMAHGVTRMNGSHTGDADGTGIDMLKFLKLFKGYADPDKYFDFSGGEVIFKEGDLGDLMFIILEGTVNLTAQAGEKTQVLASLSRGEFFGESALLTDLPRSATASAEDDVTVLPVVRKDLVEGLISDPESALQLVKILILRLRRNLELLVGEN